MYRSSVESFIRSGGGRALVLRYTPPLSLGLKQDGPTGEATVSPWVDDVWKRSFGATTQAILKTKPFEFSAAGLSGLDQEALRTDAVNALLAAMEREGFDLTSAEGEQRALAILSGVLNQRQQEAMGVEFYVWTTQHDAQVRGSHAGRDDRIFRWDDPPEGGHPSQDYGCRCFARALGVEGYWERVREGVEAFAADLARWEGNVDHMYLDSEDNVTVGIGTLLPNAESAVALEFRNRATDRPASVDDIRAEFDRIDSMTGSNDLGASSYRRFADLYLPQSDIDRLVHDHMRGDFDDLLRMFPNFGNFPLPAQIALWDMTYNLGSGGLRREFPSLLQAVADGDWEEAARQSHRRGPSEERNQYVFDLFMDAAEEL